MANSNMQTGTLCNYKIGNYSQNQIANQLVTFVNK